MSTLVKKDNAWVLKGSTLVPYIAPPLGSAIVSEGRAVGVTPDGRTIYRAVAYTTPFNINMPSNTTTSYNFTLGYKQFNNTGFSRITILGSPRCTIIRNDKFTVPVHGIYGNLGATTISLYASKMLNLQSIEIWFEFDYVTGGPVI